MGLAAGQHARTAAQLHSIKAVQARFTVMVAVQQQPQTHATGPPSSGNHRAAPLLASVRATHRKHTSGR